MALTVRDPIHGSIRLEDWVTPIVDHPVFQRLRRVQQLGTAHLVYPGAHHKRFEHSLGAYHLAGRLAIGMDLDEESALVLRAAALLHDVGHGPFSHAFEELAKHEGHRHEDTTVDLVRWGPLADLLRQGGVDPVAVSDAVVGEGPVAPLVSGSLDADRMDYLLRDAHYTGVRASADPDRIAAVIEHHPEHGIVLRESGIIAAEALLTTRFLMYPAVYLHHSVRASERMLQRGIEAIIDDGVSTFKQLERSTDDALMHKLREAPGVASELAQRLDERRLYKRAVEGRPDDEAAVEGLADAPARRRELEDEIAAKAGVAGHEVLVDVPHAPKFHEMSLHVHTRDDRLVPLAEQSTLVAALQAARTDHWRFWVFAPARHADAVGAAARSVLGMRAVK